MTDQLSSACPDIREGLKLVSSKRRAVEPVQAAPVETEDAPWLVALDIDGTMLHEDGSISDAVIEQVRRVDAAGHQVMLATGRGSAATIPVLEHLGITPRFLVCSKAQSPCTVTPGRQAATGANGWSPLTRPMCSGRSRRTLGTPASRSKTNTVATGTPNRFPTLRSGATASTWNSMGC
jgi:haloacid dehalogenase-like hydrolase